MFDFTWTIYLVILIALFSYNIGSKTHTAVFYALFYTLLSSVFVSYSNFRFIEPQVKHMMDWSIVSAGFTMLLVCYAFSSIHKSVLIRLFRITSIFPVIYSLILIVDTNYAYGIVEHSMAGCFTVICLPVLNDSLKGKWKWLLLIPVVAIIMNNSQSTHLLFGILIFLTLWLKAPLFRVFWSFCAFVALFLAVPYAMKTDGERINAYWYFLNYWWEKGSVLFGQGNGFFYSIGPKYFKFAGNNWGHPHSDLIQSLINLGLVGCVLWAWALIVALYRAHRDNVIFTSLCLVIVWGVVQYPLYRAWDCFLVALVFFLSIRLKDKKKLTL